jgi:hypothetical protein
MKIVEVLTQYGTIGAVDIPAAFTVNNAVLNVPAEYTALTEIYEHVLSNDNENDTFDPADNLNIISAGISVPFPFSVFDEQFIVQMGFENGEGDFVPFPGFGGGGMLFTFDNFEVPLGLFFSIADSTMATYKIGAKIVSRDLTPLRISMLNIPDALNTEVFTVSVFLKIEHNLPMS